MSHVTLTRYCRKNRIRPNPHIAPYERHYGAFPQWLREHPDEKLPKSIKAIANVTGCTQDEIKSYFYRRRKEVKLILKEIPDIRKYPLVLKGRYGEWLDTQAIIKYNYVINHWTCAVTIVTVYPDRVHFIDLKDVSKFKREVLKACAQSQKNGIAVEAKAAL